MSDRQQYSDEALLAGLREAAAQHGDPLTAEAYDRHSGARGAATSARVIQRFGTWNAACSRAGLRTNKGRPSYARAWSEDQVAGHVADYLATGTGGSYAGYIAYAQATPGAPSAQTVRNAFGGWAAAKEAAARLHRDGG